MMNNTIATAPMPECNAPSTKYGPNTEDDQPGRIAIAKSQDTMVCTENMTGIIANAKKFMAVVRCRHSPSVPRKPKARILKKALRHPVERSRAIAKSGISGKNKYIVLPRTYVVIASKSHIKGEWKLGHNIL